MPVVVASGNGLRAVEKTMELLNAGHDPLDVYTLEHLVAEQRCRELVESRYGTSAEPVQS